jgi:hypothetical protein
MDKASSARPPVPSAAESAHTSIVAPVIAFVIFMAFGGTTKGTAGWPFICISCLGLILLGIVSSMWGFYVAAFYGPRKHISTAVLGLALNVAVVAAPIALALWSDRHHDEYESSYDARASQIAVEHYRN